MPREKALLTEDIPDELLQAMFRVAGVAFFVATVVNLGAAFVASSGPPDPKVWLVSGLACAGGLVTWFFPWHRLPIRRFMMVVVIPGLALFTAILMLTGGVHSPALAMFVVPSVFMAAAFGLRAGLLTAALCVAGAATPLLVGNWDAEYARHLVVLAASTGLSAYIPAQVRTALAREAERRTQQQEAAYVATIAALAAALDAKDRYTEAHSRETAALATAVGMRLGLDAEALRLLEYGALLHDIGKIGIPGHILQKPGPLTTEEMDIMKQHPVIGERILGSVPFLKPLLPIVRAEHERWDGQGYPDGLRADEIPIEARIIHASDAFHAMATDRSYRKALPRDAILREFREQSGKQFDPWVVEAMLAVIEEEELELHAEAEHDHEAAPAAALSGPRSWLQHLETIEALGARLARAASIEEICQLLGETIVTILPQDQCRILLLAADRRRLEVAYLSAGARVEYQGVTIENAGVELGEGITGWVAQTKRGVVIGDAERHPKAAHVSGTNQIDESLLAAPVVYHDELLGVILVLKVGLNQYNLDHLRLLTILANQVAVAIANVRLSAQLASAARTDALTGLSNRQALQDALENQIRNPAARFSIIVLDVEQLKQTNDALGMGAGDRVLRRVADVLRAVLRKDDIAARWVSDQFVVILPGFGDLAARAVAKRIWTELLKPGDGEEAITVHWGTASCPEHGSSWDELFTWAERSLQGARQERQEPAA